MKKKKLTDKQYHEHLNRLYEQAEITGNERRKYCQYYLGGERYCKANMQKSCKKCRMFSPTTQTKMKVILDYCLQLEDTICELKLEHNKKECRIERLKADNKMLNRYYEEHVRPYASIGKSILRHRKKVSGCEP